MYTRNKIFYIFLKSQLGLNVYYYYCYNLSATRLGG